MTVLSRLLAFTCLVGSIAASAAVEGSEPVQVLETRSMHELEPRANKQPHSHKKKSTQHHEKKHETKHHDSAPAALHHEKRGHCKAGLGWVDRGVSQKPFQKGACWCYSWSPWSCSTVLESVPMFWGPKQADAWHQNTKGKHFPHVLHINEPEQKGQANIPVSRAVQLWHQYMETVSADRRGSPAVTTSPDGFTWLTGFMKQCKGCRIAFVNLHYYGTNPQDFIKQITKFHNAVNLPVWVTEWACHDYSGRNHQCDYAQTQNFLKVTQAWLDRTPWVERYAYYGTLKNINIHQTNRLMSSSGEITALGKMYLKQ